MQLPLGLLLFLLSSTLSRAASPHKREHSTHNYYVLEHDPRAGVSLSDVAQHLGIQVIERAGELENFWLVRQEKPADGLEARDSVLDTVNSIRRRSFASLLSRAPDPSFADRLDSSIRWISPQERRQRFKRAPPPIRPGHDYIKSADVATKLDIHDPEFPRQWHLSNDEFPEHMMNISGLWEMGITGKGVISALVDDGLDWQSKDLADNFYAEGSYDYNDHEPLPTPKLFDDHHGTRCAGQIAAVKNDVCGVGIAYESKVAGLRILSGPISDVDEAASLNNDYQNTAIYSCSWGPPDNGKSMEAPGYLIERAMINGIENGRHGKGSIYVFASGNGAGFGDQCNFDGYTNSIYSVTVSAIDYKGLHPYYSEPCAANLIVAYSSGSGNHIVTTDINGKCADSHGGTSAAAPNAVGVYALALSVRPELTWRDIQHLNVRTAEVINPNDRDWETTATGRQYSYKYGYGRLDGYKFVMAAKEWELVKPQAWIEFAPIQIGGGTCDVLGQMEGGDPIPAGGLQHTISVTQDDLDKNNFATLEHVTVRVWIKHARRGDVEVELISPNGVKSILAASRKGDADTDGFPGWRFMTVKHWDENPLGDWTLRVGDIEAEERTGTFLGWQLSLFGAVQDPAEVKTYELSSFPILLPSVSSTTSTQNPSPTKTLAKPGDHLPTDHGTAPGEADKPAFDNTNPSAPSSSSSMTPTPDEGWFAGMGTLATNGKWFFGAAALVLVFGIGAGIFFWRRRIRSREAAYSALPGDNVAMRSIPGSRGTKELYNAFGEGEDDDEDADEQTRLAPDRVAEGTSTAGLGFHSEFLDDDDASAAGTPAPPRYHDAPESEKESEKRSDDDGSRSPVGSGSADGSWEHASQTR